VLPGTTSHNIFTNKKYT